MVTKPSIVRSLTNLTKGTCTFDHLRSVLKDVRNGSADECCPKWSCEQCKAMFPRVVHIGITKRCPCDKYDSDYLIKRLQEILRTFPKETVV